MSFDTADLKQRAQNGTLEGIMLPNIPIVLQDDSIQ